MRRFPIAVSPPAYRRTQLLALVVSLAIGLLLPPRTWAIAAPGDADPVAPTVSSNSGAASYQIPIDVPPGPGGLAPQLALTYSSHAGDSFAGVGWRLHLGEIRCTTAQRGVPDLAACNPANPNAPVRYELDGQLLSYNGPEGRWHTFVESFREIRYEAASNRWVVNTPNGTTLRYGSTPESRIAPEQSPTARWLLSEIEDPFTNQITIAYAGTAPTDPPGEVGADVGTAYPTVIAYADGLRAVRFVYEPRPDPLHDFAGGIERTVSARLQAIRVESDGQLVRQWSLGYDGTGATYTTGRSRLAWAQLVGSDGTSALPRQEFRYTDHGLSGSQWGEDSAFALDTDIHLADVNGDGLVDRVRGFRLLDTETYPLGYGSVELNTGSGWTADPGWTAALEATCCPSAYLQATLAYPDAAGANKSAGVVSASVVDDLDPEDAIAQGGLTQVYEFHNSYPPDLTYPKLYVSMNNLDMLHPSAPEPGPLATAVGGVLVPPGWGFHIADLNADGLADIVYSFYLSGITRNLDPNGAALATPEYVPGRQVLVGWRNTGSGWERDDELVSGLPPFDAVLVESVEEIQKAEAAQLAGLAAAQLPVPPSTPYNCAFTDKLLFGYYQAPVNANWDLCLNALHFAPQFVDLNGDGFLDLVATENIPPTATYPLAQSGWNLIREYSRSRAWIQDPNHAAGPRWLETEAFALPFFHQRIYHDDCDPHLSCPGSRHVDAGVRLVDVNRDGLADVVWTNPFGGAPDVSNAPAQPEGVLINLGSGAAPGSAWCSSHDSCPWAAVYVPPAALAIADPSTLSSAGYVATFTSGHLADLNGDGWVDFVFALPWPFTNTLLDVEGPWVGAWLQSRDGVDTPAGGVPELWESQAGSLSFDPPDLDLAKGGLTVADVNGDGAGDLEVHLYAGTRSAYTSGATALASETTNAPDLLREVKNGRGGTITVDYARASLQRDPELETLAASDAISLGEGTNPGPGGLWHLPVVAAVTIAGWNLTSTTTAYAYAHPRFSADFRSNLGFRLLERIRPDGSKVKEFYTQSHGRAGRLSQLFVTDPGNQLVFWQRQTWEEPPGTVPGSPASPEVFKARLTEVRTVRGTYSGVVPGFPTLNGPVQVRTLTYDDDYGFNFVKQVDETRPTGALRTRREPVSPSATRWLRGFVAAEWQEDPATNQVLRRSAFTYTAEGRVETRADDVQRRGEAQSLATTAFVYDGFGNLRSRTEALGTSLERTTDFCYDGDGDWCPSPADQTTHSVLVGIRQTDPVDGGALITELAPDPRTGAIAALDPAFDDEPGLERDFDPFGRVIAERLTPLGGVPFLATAVEYHDELTPPVVERRSYIDRSGTSFVRTATVDDGFGGVWKTISPTPGGWVGTAVWHDPVNSRVRETYPVACADDTCSALTGGSEIATETETDILGRPVEVTTPDGTSSATYGVASRAPPGGGPDILLEAVMLVNPTGRTRRLLDGDRLVWVDECTDDQPTCPSADRTYYAYAASGELETVYDPRVGSGQALTSDPAHKLAYHYDTRGRVWKIEDPDGGTSTTVYDLFGNAIEAQNARQQGTANKTIFEYDSLDRLERIDQPPGQQRDYVITYDPDQRQPRLEQILAQNGTQYYALTWTYDDLGRVFRKQFQFPGKTFLLDFTYDELGRTTSLHYPDETVVRYVFEGAYLKKICEVASPLLDCSDESAIFYLGSSSEDGVVYDELGRRATIQTPAGERSYTYDEVTQRLATDHFASTTPDLYTRTLSYVDYDPLGNLLQIDGTSTGSAVDYSVSYTYDRRNRLASWQKPGVGAVPPTPQAYFNYDALGNLIGHAVPSPTATNQAFGQTSRPHGVTAQADAGTNYTYDLDGNLESETWVGGGGRYYVFDSLNRLSCVGSSPSGCNTLQVDYDSGGSRIAETYLNASGASVPRRYADEFFTLDNDRGDFHIFAFGERIAYKRKAPVALRTAGTWALPGIELPEPPPLALAILAALGIAGVGLVAVRRDWAPGLREDPALGALALALVVALVLPPLPARAGGGGQSVLYRRWILSDPLGSATVVLEANPQQQQPGSQEGRAEREVVYAPFGAVHQAAGSQGLDTEVFAGHPREPATGLHYMQARWQDPTTGSFLSVDPLVANGDDPQAFHAYAYARSNPVLFTDPTGMAQEGYWPTWPNPAPQGSGFWGNAFAPPFSGGGGGGFTEGSQSEPTVLAEAPPTKAEEQIKTLEEKLVRIRSELQRLRADQDCLGRTGMLCEEIEVAENPGTRVLEGIREGLELDSIGRPGSDTGKTVGQVLVNPLILRRIQKEIGRLETLERGIVQSIDRARQNEGRRVYPRRRGGRRRTRRGHLLLTLLIVMLAACNGSAALEIRIGFFGPDACSDCKPVAFQNALGDQETMFIAEAPSVEISRSDIYRMQAWQEPDGSWGIAITIEPRAWASVVTLASNVRHDSAIVVLYDGVLIGSYSGETVLTSHGSLTFGFIDEERFHAVLAALGGFAEDVRVLSREDELRECQRASGGRAEVEERCQRIMRGDVSSELGN